MLHLRQLRRNWGRFVHRALDSLGRAHVQAEQTRLRKNLQLRRRDTNMPTVVYTQGHYSKQEYIAFSSELNSREDLTVPLGYQDRASEFCTGMHKFYAPSPSVRFSLPLKFGSVSFPSLVLTSICLPCSLRWFSCNFWSASFFPSVLWSTAAV